jgi:hypothetical protein
MHQMLKVFNIHHLFILRIIKRDINIVKLNQKPLRPENYEVIIKKKRMHDLVHRHEWKYELIVSFQV